MSIQFSTPPSEVSRAVEKNLRLVGEQPPITVRGLGGAVAAQVTATMPHGVYVLGLQDVLAGRLPDDMTPSAWRYILQSDGDAVASAETQVQGSAHKFSGFNSGPYVASTVATLRRMEDIPQARNQNLTVRMLRIPALHLMALWLHGDGEDLFTPLEPTPPGVDAHRQYRAPELFAALRSEAESRVGVGPSDLTGG